jgi:hypothetical protein
LQELEGRDGYGRGKRDEGVRKIGRARWIGGIRRRVGIPKAGRDGRCAGGKGWEDRADWKKLHG